MRGYLVGTAFLSSYGGTWKERGKQMKDNVILGTALFLSLIGAATVLGWMYWAICAIAGV